MKPCNGNRKAFVIVTVSSRVDSLNLLLETIERHVPDFADWDVCVFMQDNLGVANRVDRSRITQMFVVSQLMGCNAARIELLKRIRYEVYCNLDDDIELTEYTHYEPAIAKCLEPTTGFVLTNWARTESLLAKKVPAMEDKFVKQALIYQGGGMLYSDKIAELIRRLPSTPTVFDEGWPLTAYINGYTNYRYLGSLAIHRVCTKGGMNEWYKSVDYSKLPNLFPQYINYEQSERGEWHIPLDNSLTELAKRMHRENAARLVV